MANQVKFIIFKDRAGGFRWRLVAGNGEQVAVSESYVSHHGAIDSAYKIMEIAGTAIVTEE